MASVTSSTSSAESISRVTTPGSVYSVAGSVGSPMRSFGDSYFESVNTMTVDYLQKKQSKKTTTTSSTTQEATALHGYGATWFENNTQQFEELQKKRNNTRPKLAKMNSYGSQWFDNYESQWEDWQRSKQARLA